MLVVALIAFAVGSIAMLLGHEEALLGLMILALLGGIVEVVAKVVRLSGGERSRSERR